MLRLNPISSSRRSFYCLINETCIGCCNIIERFTIIHRNSITVTSNLQMVPDLMENI